MCPWLEFPYAYQRYYTSGLGRFLTADPFDGSASPSSPQTWNRYPYAGSDPTNNNDPSGLDCGGIQNWQGGGCGPGLGEYGDGDNWQYMGGGYGGYTDGGCVVGQDGYLESPIDGYPCGGSDPPPPPAPIPSPKPIQCDVQLWGDQAKTVVDPVLHTWLTVSIYNPNNGSRLVTTYEALPVGKDTPLNRLLGFPVSFWLNKFSYSGGLPGSELFDFASEYSSAALCADATLIAGAYTRYHDNTVAYNLFVTNSNTFTAWLLGQTWGSLQIPTGLSLELLVRALGWFSALPPNP
jgi:RHS repeat-associated protein